VKFETAASSMGMNLDKKAAFSVMCFLDVRASGEAFPSHADYHNTKISFSCALFSLDEHQGQSLCGSCLA